jgi:hypothetical protein
MKRLLLMCALCHACSPSVLAGDAAFSGRVVVELLGDSESDHRLRLLEDFSFRDPRGRVWTAHAGGIVDGTTLPGMMPDWVQSPRPGRLRMALVLHDYFVEQKAEPWRDVHRMLYAAAIAEGVSPPEAKTEYLGVYAAGWRWEPRGSSCYRSCHAAASTLAWRPIADMAALRPLVDWIWESAPSLDDIDRRADALIAKPGPHLFSQGY